MTRKYKEISFFAVTKTLIGAMLFLLVLYFFSCAYAITIEYKEAKTVSLYEAFGTEEKWHATAYDIKDVGKLYEYCGMHPYDCKDNEGQDPAMKLCFWHDDKTSQACYRIEDPPEGKQPRYGYDIAKDLRIMQLCKDCDHRSGLLLHARNEGFTVGHINALSIWTYDYTKERFVNILPVFKFIEQGEYKIIPYMKGGIEGIIVEANPIIVWGKETRYGPHRFLIGIFQLGPDGYYKKVGYYETKKKYPSLDDVSKVNVIIPEMKNIRTFILQKTK